MKDYLRMLDSLIEDYKKDPKSKQREGAIAALLEAKNIAIIINNQ